MGPTITQQGDLTCIGDKLRIEQGPRLITAVATEELLHDDATAKHYYAGERPWPGPDGQVVMRVGVDALGKVIQLGQPMTYAAWGGEATDPDLVFKVYQLRSVTPDPDTTLTERWEKVGEFDTRDEALAAAFSLA